MIFTNIFRKQVQHYESCPYWLTIPEKFFLNIDGYSEHLHLFTSYFLKTAASFYNYLFLL